MSRDPRRDECTICTAVAPEAVFTVRTYATRPLYDPKLVRRSAPPTAQNTRSAHRAQLRPATVIKVRSHCRRGEDQSGRDHGTECLTIDRMYDHGATPRVAAALSRLSTPDPSTRCRAGALSPVQRHRLAKRQGARRPRRACGAGRQLLGRRASCLDPVRRSRRPNARPWLGAGRGLAGELRWACGAQVGLVGRWVKSLVRHQPKSSTVLMTGTVRAATGAAGAADRLTVTARGGATSSPPRSGGALLTRC
jgi:hypothetical protein